MCIFDRESKNNRIVFDAVKLDAARRFARDGESAGRSRCHGVATAVCGFGMQALHCLTRLGTREVDRVELGAGVGGGVASEERGESSGDPGSGFAHARWK